MKIKLQWLLKNAEAFTYAAVKDEKRKQASRKPGKDFIPAFSMAITNADRNAVGIPSSRDSDFGYHEI